MSLIQITDATPAQLRAFGANTLGLELHGRETAQMMVGKFAEVGYNLETIKLEEPATVPSGRPDGDTAFNTRVRADGIKEARIVIHTQDKPGGEEPVPVTVNGSKMFIERGVPSWVPEHFIEALDHAVEDVYSEFAGGSGNLGGLAKPRKVHSYPFSYA